MKGIPALEPAESEAPAAEEEEPFARPLAWIPWGGSFTSSAMNGVGPPAPAQ